MRKFLAGLALGVGALAMAGAAGAGDDKSAKDYAPGQLKEKGYNATKYAPGQTKPAGESAKEQAPGQKATEGAGEGQSGSDKPSGTNKKPY